MKMKIDFDFLESKIGDFAKIWRNPSREEVEDYDISCVLLNRRNADFLISVTPRSYNDIFTIKEVFESYHWMDDTFQDFQITFDNFKIGKTSWITVSGTELYAETLASTQYWIEEKLNQLFKVEK